MDAHVDGAAVALAAGVGLITAPYLARLTLSVPDREHARWWTGRPASPKRTAVTALVAVVFGALAGAAAGWTALLPAFLALALITTPLVPIDLEHHRLPNRLTFLAGGAAAALLTLAAAIDGDWHAWLRGLEGAAAVYAVLFVIMVIASFGFGDVKLGGVLGAYLGWFSWSAVYYGMLAGFVVGAVVAVGLLAAKRATRKTAIAFGPWMTLGALLVLAFDLVPNLQAG